MTQPDFAFHAARRRREMWLHIVGAIASLGVGGLVIYFLYGTGQLDSDVIIKDAEPPRGGYHHKGGSGIVLAVVIGLGFIAASALLAWRAWRLRQR